MRRIVINGATSMIGINLIHYILKEDVEVLAIIRKNSSKKNLLPRNDKVKIVECDLEDLNSLNICESKSYDDFVHLAWKGTIGEERNDVYIQSKNIEYTLDAVKLAKGLGCNSFIGAGSQAEYGRVEGMLKPETPTNPENAYGMAKLCAGNLSRVLANSLGMRHIWTRILSVYGPYNDERTMIMSSIREMLNGLSPKYTKAEQQWDYLYVEDLVRAIYLIIQKGKENSIYCIGSGEKRPLLEYIQEIRNQINPNIELKIGAREYELNQVMNLCADITNLAKDTGFKPEISFKEGIKRTIEWYKNRN